MSPESTEEQSVESGHFLAGWRKWSILVVVLALVIGGGYTVWKSRGGNSTPSTTNTTTNTSGTPRTTNSSSVSQQVTIPVATDLDKDGLLDPREAELKTNPKLADSDGDQVSDFDEVEIYATDPLKQDTDGDGYPDGEELRSGNNPKGPGKLFDLTQTLSNINAQ